MVKIRNIPSNKTLPHVLSFYDCSRKRALGWRTLMLPTKTMSVFIFSFSSHIIYWETKEKAHLIVDDLKYNKVYVFYFISTKHVVTSDIEKGNLVLYGNISFVVNMLYHGSGSTIYNKENELITYIYMALKIAKH